MKNYFNNFIECEKRRGQLCLCQLNLIDITVNVTSAQINSIVSLKEIPFIRCSNKDKLPIKELGQPRRNLNIKHVSTKGGKSYKPGFSRTWSKRRKRLTLYSANLPLHSVPPRERDGHRMDNYRCHRHASSLGEGEKTRKNKDAYG